MKQIAFTSKLVLALIATVAFSAALSVPSIVAQPGPPGGGGGGPSIPDNFITSEMIIDGEVKTQDLADGAVTSDKLASGALIGVETHFVSDSIVLEIGETRGFRVDCPEGEQVTGGGYVSDPDMPTYINSPHEGAAGIPIGWTVAAQNNGNQAHQLTGFVICAQSSS